MQRDPTKGGERHQSLLVSRVAKKVSVNVDCVKVCPMNSSIWAFSFYQQLPTFKGGIQVLQQSQIEKEISEQEAGSFKVELGPIMHIQWLKQSGAALNKPFYYILGVHRSERAYVCGYDCQDHILTVLREIYLQENIFCLYCDWQLVSTQNEVKDVLAVVSTDSSTVFQLSLQIKRLDAESQQKAQEHHEILASVDVGSGLSGFSYADHQYAVWACKLSSPKQDGPSKRYLVVGDEVDCLYLYDTGNYCLLGKNKKAHSQGICELVWLDPQTILSGSFDGTIAQTNVNHFGEVVRRYSFGEGSTIWRIILPWNQALGSGGTQGSGEGQLMQIFKGSWLICNSSKNEFLIFEPLTQRVMWSSGQGHKSLAYSADWNSELLITASFYDQMLRVWQTGKQAIEREA